MKQQTIMFVAFMIWLSPAHGDELLYRYEGEVLPYDVSAGWEVSDPCEPPCSELINAGHFLLSWPFAADFANYTHWIARTGEPIPHNLWVEWQFRSNHSIGPSFYTCDGAMKIVYDLIVEVVFMYGDAAVSFSGDDAITELLLTDFHTFRFESMDGVGYTITTDGREFITRLGRSPQVVSGVQINGRGGCGSDQIPDMRNEWDFVRYGTITYGERVISADPLLGFLDPTVYAGLDRFTVTFDSPNYVYVHEITVETTGLDTPIVLQTRRLDNGPAETVEIVLDRPLPPGEHTRFILDDGAIQNIIDYSYILGDADGNGALDLADAAGLLNCFGRASSAPTCAAFDMDASGLVDATDVAPFTKTLTGPRRP